MKTYLIFCVVGYNKELKVGTDVELVDKVVMRLIADTYENAETHANKISPREHWFLAEVTEFEVADKKE